MATLQSLRNQAARDAIVSDGEFAQRLLVAPLPDLQGVWATSLDLDAHPQPSITASYSKSEKDGNMQAEIRQAAAQLGLSPLEIQRLLVSETLLQVNEDVALVVSGSEKERRAAMRRLGLPIDEKKENKGEAGPGLATPLFFAMRTDPFAPRLFASAEAEPDADLEAKAVKGDAFDGEPAPVNHLEMAVLSDIVLDMADHGSFKMMALPMTVVYGADLPLAPYSRMGELRQMSAQIYAEPGPSYPSYHSVTMAHPTYKFEPELVPT